MAIIELAPRIPTEQEKNDAVVRRLLRDSIDSLIAHAKKHKELFDLFWKNAQAYCDVMGTSAKMFFEESMRTQKYLGDALGAKFLPFVCNIPADKVVTIGEDGTVTITNKEQVNE